MKKVYVGCAMFNAPSEYLLEIAEIKEAIKEGLACEVLEFLPLGTGTPEEVYTNDIHQMVEACDIMIAEVSFPSLGLGWELGTMVEKLRKPVIMCAKKGAKVSRLVQGAENEKNPNCRFLWYESHQDLLDQIKNILTN